jgi:hypothetical protein
MRKRVVLTLIFVSIFAYSNAQLISNLYQAYTPNSLLTSASDSTIFSEYGVIKPGKPVYNISFGAGYTSFGRGMGFSSSTISPTMAFAPTEKLQLVVGASFSYMNLNNMPVANNMGAAGNLQQTAGNPSQAFAYGQYQVNNRLTVFAMGAFAKNQMYVSPFYAGIGRADYQQMGFGLNYKISRRATIGASFNYSNGPGYMGLSPNSGFNNFNTFGPMFP